MALRTRSTSARAAIAASRIKQSETERLQSAIKEMESAIGKYNKDKQKRSNKRGLFSALGKLGSIVTKAGAYVGNPLVAGAGLAVSGVSGYAEGSLSKKQAEKAEDIRTDFTEPLSNLLFVGQTAKDVQKGAENLKSVEEQATDEQYAADLFRIGSGLAMQTVTAGQAGTFDSIAGGTSDFLNKPLLDLGEAPGEDADAMTKFLYNQRKTATPSVGQLLGGVSPAQQQMGQSFIQDAQAKKITKQGLADNPFLLESDEEFFSNDNNFISNSFPTFSSVIPSQQNVSTNSIINQQEYNFPLSSGLGVFQTSTQPTTRNEIQDAFATLRQTVNRYNQGGIQ